ncbi:phosphotransferase [Reinekea sp. G2M2-21]|uniref:phosphotransferase n=1 Tax=Reinekea sp. G2M2-21 TaxID=2788942 RepID=UPI0018AB5BBE|nr:phosphotransferase [Reinekea sp. G2M2-21]
MSSTTQKMKLHQALAQLRPLIGSNVAVRRTPNALTNTCYQLDNGKHRYSLRLNNSQAFDLGISRMRETVILTHVSAEPWAVEVVDINEHWLLTKWIQGTTFRPNSKKEIEQLAKLVKHVHSCQIQPNDTAPPLNVCEQIEHLLTHCHIENNVILALIKDRCLRYKFPEQLTLCFHDWHPGNLIQETENLILIDWEYAASGDPVVDIACLMSGFQLDEPLRRYLQDSLQVSDDHLESALCLTELMSILWYQVRFPDHSRMNDLLAWQQSWQNR